MSNRRRQLARKLRGVELGFEHAGASCPRCGYVFSRGFSNVTSKVTDPNSPATLTGVEAVTVCTRCLRKLALQDGKLRELNAVELMLLNDEERRAFALMEEIAKMHTEGQS